MDGITGPALTPGAHVENGKGKTGRVAGAPAGDNPLDKSAGTLIELLGTLLAGAESEWRIRTSEAWCHVDPAGQLCPARSRTPSRCCEQRRPCW
jgi:hypothetical protein